MNLHDLHGHGLTATLHRDRLTVAPAERLTDELRASIRHHKAGLVAELLNQPRRLWLVHFADREPRIFSILPEANHAEMRALYPASTKAEALEYVF